MTVQCMHALCPVGSDSWTCKRQKKQQLSFKWFTYFFTASIEPGMATPSPSPPSYNTPNMSRMTPFKLLAQPGQPVSAMMTKRRDRGISYDCDYIWVTIMMIMVSFWVLLNWTLQSSEEVATWRRVLWRSHVTRRHGRYHPTPACHTRTSRPPQASDRSGWASPSPLRERFKLRFFCFVLVLFDFPLIVSSLLFAW